MPELTQENNAMALFIALHQYDCHGFFDSNSLQRGKLYSNQGRVLLGLVQTPLSGVFGIEKASKDRQGLHQAVDRIVAIIQAGPHKDRIDKIITRWLKRHLQRLGAEVNLDQFNSLVEDRAMLAENLENWAQQERQEGRQEAEQRALESKRNAARKLIALTEMNDQLIAEIEELTVEEVERLRAETQH